MNNNYNGQPYNFTNYQVSHKKTLSPKNMTTSNSSFVDHKFEKIDRTSNNAYQPINNNNSSIYYQNQNQYRNTQNQNCIDDYENKKIHYTNLKDYLNDNIKKQEQKSFNQNQNIYPKTSERTNLSKKNSVSSFLTRPSKRINESNFVHGHQRRNSRIISEQRLESRIIAEHELEKSVIRINKLEPRVKSQRDYEGNSKIVSEFELPRRQRKSVRRSVKNEQVQIETIQRQKIVEIIKEKPVPVERYVNVAYDVYVDVPIERTIEKEKIMEVLIEKPFEKIVEIPIEQIIEIPVERIIEIPVEVKKYVERPYEKIVQRPYDVFKENIIWKDKIIDIDERDISNYKNVQVLPTEVNYQKNQKIVENIVYYDNIIDKEVKVPIERRIEIPREKIIEKKIPYYIERPVPVEKIIHKEIEIPIEVPVYKNVEVLIERPIYIENIIEKRIPVEVIIEKEIEIPVEHLVEVPVYIDNIIEKKVDNVVEVRVAYEQVLEVPVEEITENFIDVEEMREVPVDKIIKKSVPFLTKKEVLVDVEVEKYIQEEVQIPIDRMVNRYTEREFDQIIEKPVYIERTREVPIEIEKITEIPLQYLSENIKIVEKIIEKPVYFDTIIEKRVEYIVEKIVEVFVEKIIEVPITIYIEKPVFKEIIIEEEILVETNTVQIHEDPNVEELFEEFEDEEMNRDIVGRTSEKNQEEIENSKLNNEYQDLLNELENLKRNASLKEARENINLITKLAEIQSMFRNEKDENEYLKYKVETRTNLIETVLNSDPQVESTKRKLIHLVEENQILCGKIKSKGKEIRKSLLHTDNNNINTKSYNY